MPSSIAAKAPVPLEQLDAYTWRIPQEPPMRVPGMVFASRTIMEAIVADESLLQVRNVACLPGIVRYSIAMPDIHQGYGFPIGGVAATRLKDGVISPGGVGYDINCGVRLVATDLEAEALQKDLATLADNLFATIPAGVGAQGAIRKPSSKEFDRLLTRGASWAVEHGYGHAEDLDYIEEGGCLEGADPDRVSRSARDRGIGQVGTLGSGNHFVEVQRVERIHDPRLAEGLGLFEGQVVYTVHSGSRGFGHQTCTDYIRQMHQAMHRYHIQLPDRQLACAPLDSDEGRAYFAAMKCAANYAWVNRQVMMYLAELAFQRTLHIGPRQLGRRLIYDVCHNIAKIEQYPIDGRMEQVCVHRKGATRAMPPGHPLTPEAYKEVGQPVLIPGDMGRASYVLVGTQRAVEESFGSSCHGAGRRLSRRAAKAKVNARELVDRLAARGIQVRARGMRTLSEEAPEAYKDVSEVVAVMEGAGLSRIVARLAPMAVVKG
ncbi:MAG: RtcB family protein [Armatimonadetes bacterium]|nr:RtcB family protein [Armatimonadota bacterium]